MQTLVGAPKPTCRQRWQGAERPARPNAENTSSEQPLFRVRRSAPAERGKRVLRTTTSPRSRPAVRTEQAPVATRRPTRGDAAPPQRIVSVSPNLTEILYGLGVFDRVVGVTDYCTYPPEAKSRERVGGWSTPNLERIVRLHPDLVVLTQAQAPILAYNLKQLGIHFLVTPSQSVPDVFSAINEVGAAMLIASMIRLFSSSENF